MIAKCAISAVFAIVFLYAPEIFPTTLRLRGYYESVYGNCIALLRCCDASVRPSVCLSVCLSHVLSSKRCILRLRLRQDTNRKPHAAGGSRIHWSAWSYGSTVGIGRNGTGRGEALNHRRTPLPYQGSERGGDCGVITFGTVLVYVIRLLPCESLLFRSSRLSSVSLSVPRQIPKAERDRRERSSPL